MIHVFTIQCIGHSSAKHSGTINFCKLGMIGVPPAPFTLDKHFCLTLLLWMRGPPKSSSSCALKLGKQLRPRVSSLGHGLCASLIAMLRKSWGAGIIGPPSAIPCLFRI
eukprot:320552-Chlamydomonas_euryale.AAC.19